MLPILKKALSCQLQEEKKLSLELAQLRSAGLTRTVIRLKWLARTPFLNKEYIHFDQKKNNEIENNNVF